jgi:hypothetical protein
VGHVVDAPAVSCRSDPNRKRLLAVPCVAESIGVRYLLDRVAFLESCPCRRSLRVETDDLLLPERREHVEAGVEPGLGGLDQLVFRAKRVRVRLDVFALYDVPLLCGFGVDAVRLGKGEELLLGKMSVANGGSCVQLTRSQSDRDLFPAVMRLMRQSQFDAMM